MDINIGDNVRWESQALGCYTSKKGTVIAILPPDEDAFPYLPMDTKKSHIKFQNRSSIKRVLVKVMAGANHDIAHYYAPRVSVLEKIGDSI